MYYLYFKNNTNYNKVINILYFGSFGKPLILFHSVSIVNSSTAKCSKYLKNVKWKYSFMFWPHLTPQMKLACCMETNGTSPAANNWLSAFVAVSSLKTDEEPAATSKDSEDSLLDEGWPLPPLFPESEGPARFEGDDPGLKQLAETRNKLIKCIFRIIIWIKYVHSSKIW